MSHRPTWGKPAPSLRACYMPYIDATAGRGSLRLLGTFAIATCTDWIPRFSRVQWPVGFRS